MLIDDQCPASVLIGVTGPLPINDEVCSVTTFSAFYESISGHLSSLNSAIIFALLSAMFFTKPYNCRALKG